MLASARMSTKPARERVHIGLVIALMRPFQPGRVLERLGAVLEGIGSADVASVVVDGDSVRWPVVDRVLRRARLRTAPVDFELEVAAEGLLRLARDFEPQLVIVATDALLDREDRDLACVHRFAIEFALATQRPLGFFTSPASSAPRADGAPATPRLARDLVLVPGPEAGGRELSRTELRELWDAPDPSLCCDLRTVDRIGAARLDPARMSAQLLRALAGPADLRVAGIAPSELIHSIDRAAFPAEIRHGDLLPVEIRGWASGVPPVRTVEIRAGRSMATAPVVVHRPDVVAGFPGVREEVCGFDLATPLGPFDPGTYAVVWGVPGTDRRETMGVFHVAPRLEIADLEVIVPRTWLPDGSAPLGVRGRVLSTAPARLRVRVDDVELAALRTNPLHRRSAGEPDVVEFRAQIALRAPGADHVVEVLATDEAGREETRRVPVRVEDGGAPGLLWRAREVGAHDPARRGTPVRLAGQLFTARAGDRVVLRRDGAEVAAVAPVPWGDVEGTSGLASFALADEVAGLVPGAATLELALVHADGTSTALDAWPAEVVGVVAGLEVTALDLAPAGAREARVVVEGRIEGATGVDSLLLYVDGDLRARLGGEWLEPASPLEGVAAAIHFFRFDSTIRLDEGGHRFEIRLRRGLEERSGWQRELEFARAEAGRTVRISSAALDRLVREEVSPVWSRLEIAGTVVGARAGDEVDLVVARRRIGRTAVDADGGFTLAAHPRPGGVARGRLRVARHGVTLARSPWFRIAPRALAVPAASVGDLEELLARLLPGAAAAGAFPAEGALRAVFEREPGAIGDFERALALLARRSREAAAAPGEVIAEPAAASGRPLRVLFAAWEPPCSLHGGGVAIRNTLQALGPRHEITLVHTCAPGEEGLSEEVRPWVRELIAVRREWRPPNFETGLGVSPAFAWSYSPDYRRAIEGELATGAYDLFNGDFLRTALHADVAGRASLGVAHEIESYAAAVTVPARFASPELAADWLAPFLRSLYLEAVTGPERFREYATVTEPEAAFLARILPGRRIFVSPIPIDVEALGAAADLRNPAPAPFFLFFGNFIHPPNRDAARLLAEQVAPRVHERLPGCRFVIAGSNPPAELLGREGRFGVHVPGYVPDLTGLTATCTAVLAPIFQGAGMRVKLLEAMAAGCPVVSTALGFSGIGGEAGETWLLADSVDGFVDTALRLAGDAELAARVGRQGRAFVAGQYSVPAQGLRRERIWYAALAAGGANP